MTQREPLHEAAYRLPNDMPEHYQLLHADLLARLREESMVVPHFGTIQELLVERIAYNYVILRWKETGEAGAHFDHERNQKEFNTYWLTMTREFNAGLRQSMDMDEFKTYLTGQVVKAVNRALSKVEDATVGATLRETFAQELSGVGL